MTKKKKLQPNSSIDQASTQSAQIVTTPLSEANTTKQLVPTAVEQKPESSQNSTESRTPDTGGEGTKTEASAVPLSAQPQISEEDRKALENLATAIGIPQIVAEIKRIGEQVNVLTGAKTGATTPAVGGAAAGFLKPIMDKAPELIDGIMKWISGTGQLAQPTMISGIDKEIMEAAIKQTMEVKQKVALANEALARIYMGGGSVMVDGNGNAVILKPKEKEEKKQ